MELADEDDNFNVELKTVEENCEIFNDVVNPLDEIRQGAAESFVMPPSLSNEYIEVEPGEDKIPQNILRDTNCEVLAFPTLLCTGKYGYDVDREIRLSPVKYFNQRLLNYKNIFSYCTDYIFYAQFVLQQLNLNSQINIAMKKVKNNTFTAGMFTQNFQQTIDNIVQNEQGFTFMNVIKGSPAF